MKTVFKPIQTLNQRTFKKNKGRNLVAVIAILMTTIMFTTLFTLAQSMKIGRASCRERVSSPV